MDNQPSCMGLVVSNKRLFIEILMHRKFDKDSIFLEVIKLYYRDVRNWCYKKRFSYIE